MTGLVRWLDADEVGEMLDLNAGYISGLVKQGRFPMPHKATRGRIDNARGRTRSYWRESDILQYKELLNMKAKKVEEYNAQINAKMLEEMRQGIDEFDKPAGLKNALDMKVKKVEAASKPSRFPYTVKPVGRPKGSWIE